jgi:hypothetical protein
MQKHSSFEVVFEPFFVKFRKSKIKIDYFNKFLSEIPMKNRNIQDKKIGILRG